MGRGGSKVKTPLDWDPTNRFQELERPLDAFSEKKWGGQKKRYTILQKKGVFCPELFFFGHMVI